MKSREGGSRHSVSIQPIETRYHECYFRSRIEARWAVFFDVAGIRWDYEPEKFLVDDGKAYIPDFFVQELGCQGANDFKRSGVFIEIKGASPEREAIDKASSLAEQSKISVLVFWGGNFDSGLEITPYERVVEKTCKKTGECTQLTADFRQCPMCGLIEAGSTDYHFCLEALTIAKRFDIYSHFHQDVVFGFSPLLELAKEAAKSARFESPEWREEIKGIILSGQRMRERNVFCAPDITTAVLAAAQSWKDGGGGPYDEPWYELHGKNLAKRVTPCDCYHCEYDRNAKRA